MDIANCLFPQPSAVLVVNVVGLDSCRYSLPLCLGPTRAFKGVGTFYEY